MTPWTRRQTAANGVVTAAGGSVLVWSWWGAAGRTALAEQHGWIALGAIGIGTIAAANVVWLLAGRRAVTSRMRLLSAAIPVPAPASPRPERPSVSGSGMRHHHRPSCQLAAGKELRPAPLEEHVAAGRRPCPTCQP